MNTNDLAFLWLADPSSTATPSLFWKYLSTCFWIWGSGALLLCCFKMNILQIAPVIASKSASLAFLRDRRLLTRGEYCVNCNQWMYHQKFAQNVCDGYVWSCPSCKARRSVRNDRSWAQRRLLHWYSYSPEMPALHQPFKCLKEEYLKLPSLNGTSISEDWCHVTCLTTG